MLILGALALSCLTTSSHAATSPTPPSGAMINLADFQAKNLSTAPALIQTKAGVWAYTNDTYGERIRPVMGSSNGMLQLGNEDDSAASGIDLGGAPTVSMGDGDVVTTANGFAFNRDNTVFYMSKNGVRVASQIQADNRAFFPLLMQTLLFEGSPWITNSNPDNAFTFPNKPSLGSTHNPAHNSDGKIEIVQYGLENGKFGAVSIQSAVLVVNGSTGQVGRVTSVAGDGSLQGSYFSQSGSYTASTTNQANSVEQLPTLAHFSLFQFNLANNLYAGGLFYTNLNLFLNGQDMYTLGRISQDQLARATRM